MRPNDILRYSFTALFLTVFFACGSSMAIDISNDPMETKVQSAPPNIMYILDDSGSMDWQFVVSGTSSSRFVKGGTDYGYLYDDAGHNYSSNSSNGRILSGATRGYWESQWHQHNLIYYNPAETYKAWPGKNNISLAGMKTVPTNPENATPTFDLTDHYLQIKPFAVVVDNSDAGFSVSEATDWQKGSSGDYYGENYLFSSASNGESDSYAEWKTRIPTTGKYTISAMWRAWDKRIKNVAYTIIKNGNTIETKGSFNQQKNGGQWNTIGDYSFEKGDTATVRMYTSDPGSTHYSADAMQFKRAGSAPVVISHIHYYVWDDTNSNDTVDDGEIYLVNFPWIDNNNNGKVEEGEIVRDYYQLRDANSNDRVDDGELFGPLTGSTIPETIQAKRTDEEGVTHILSAPEEALNFANWFTYYRKRSLTAKYAVAASLNEFMNVNVGLYTLNSDSNRLPVQPIHTEQNTLVVDNGDSGFSWSKEGWSESSHTVEYGNSSLATDKNEAWARWTPNIPTEGEFNVYVWWVDSYNNRDKNACYKVKHAGGKTDCIRKDQTQNQSTFNLIGTYTFNAGTSNYVEVIRTSPNGTYTSADAVMFEAVSGTVTMDSTEDVRNSLYSVGANGGTPLRQALNAVGNYYDTTTGGFAPSPYYSEADGGACQQAFSILMTDGNWNGGDVKTKADEGMPAPYGDTYPNTLADVAMKYYNTDLAPALPDQLPTNNYDKNIRQHMVTFSVGFGVQGNISRTDIDGDGVLDPEGACYADDPYFLNPNTPRPVWPEPVADQASTIDDLWHASVNGRGRFFSASSPEDLVDSLKAITKDINSRLASGSSVAVNGEELSAGTVLYQGTYNPGNWIGDVAAYPINKTTGEILRADGEELWKAAEQLQLKTWDDRLIFTSDGETTGINFTYDDLEEFQQAILGTADVVNFLRGEEISGMRARTQKLGDLIHSSPLLTGTITPAGNDNIDNDGDGTIDEDGENAGGTIFVGGNDGMLHAFNAQTGEERFAFIPSLVHGHLTDLTRNDYDHRFYVDATPTVKTLTFRVKASDPVQKTSQTMLVGGLARGGKGYYALDITNADDVTASSTIPTNMFKWEYPQRYFDGIDNNSNGAIDEPSEASELLEYMYRPAGSDGRDNNFDGQVDETDEMALYVRYDSNSNGKLDDDDTWNLAYIDDDLGYSYSEAVIVRSYRSMDLASKTDHPWIVVFGNGYSSANGHAVLYILDVLTGEVIRKLDTGLGGNNGLSSPVVVDVDDDDRADYVYAGDLKGNLWKFDLTSKDPDDWRIAHEDAFGLPQPMFSTPGQPITVQPDVMFHPTAHGYMVFFGTGQFLGETDRTDTGQQTIFGIWDFGDDADRREYPGVWNRSTNTVANTTGVKLQRQVIIDERYSTFNGSYLRTLSDHKPHWYLVDDDNTDQNPNPSSKPAFLTDTLDNDHDGPKDETSECDLWEKQDDESYICRGHEDIETNEGTGHVGWFFDLPGIGAMDGRDNDGDGTTDEVDERSSLASERVVKDLIIRDGKLIVLSFIPDASPCSGGGTSILHEFDAGSGSRINSPVFDISGDQAIDKNDLIDISDGSGEPILVSPTGIAIQGLVSPPAFVSDDKDRELKIFSTSAGTTEVIFELPEQLGLYYWRELKN